MIQTMNQALSPWRLLDEIAEPLGRTAGSGLAATASFPVDILEADDHLVVKVNLPGVEPGSVDVALENNTLTLSAKLEEQPEDGQRYLWRERPTGTVRRAITLPVRLNADATDASMDHGVLTVRVSKAAEATAKRIAVQTGGQPKAINV